MREQDFDQRIFDLAKKEQVHVPEGFDEKVDKALEEAMKNTKRKKYSSIRYARFCKWASPAVAAVLCVFVLSSITVYAAVSRYYERMESMSEEEKSEFVDDIQSSTENADSYSRELTQTERKRMEELTLLYEDGEQFPVGELLVVDTQDEVKEGVITFVTSSSTFYIPETELSDEDLLQMIDFYHKRDYSLSSVEKEAVVSLNDSEVAITEEEALQKACKLAEDVYGIHADDFSIFVELDPVLGYVVHMIDTTNMVQCAVQIDYTTGQFINAEYVEGTGFWEDTVLDEELYVELYETVADIFDKGIADMDHVEESYCLYRVNDQNLLYRGRVTYVFHTQDGMCYELVYIPQIQQLTEIRFWEEEDYYSYLQLFNHSLKQNSYSEKRIDFVTKE